MNIDKAINRCKELIKTEHSNWIGMSNQDAIEIVLSDREFLQDKVNWYSKEYDKLFDENNKLSKEAETWKKIAEKIAEEYFYERIDYMYQQMNIHSERELIDWARNEVEND